MKPRLQDINQKIMIHLQDLNEIFKIKKNREHTFYDHTLQDCDSIFKCDFHNF